MPRTLRSWRLAGRGDDAVFVDLAIDRRPGHPERLGRLDLVALVVLQALHDRVALHRLEGAEQPAADRPALGRQVGRADGPGTPALHHAPEDLPELLGVAGPARAEQDLHRLRRAGQ